MVADIIVTCTEYYGNMYKINPKLIRAVAYVESTLNSKAVSPNGKDVGLMQIRHQYVKESKDELLNDVCLNIKVGARILADAKKSCSHKEGYSFLLCYNRGVFGGSKVVDYTTDIYYNKVMSVLSKDVAEKHLTIID